MVEDGKWYFIYDTVMDADDILVGLTPLKNTNG